MYLGSVQNLGTAESSDACAMHRAPTSYAGVVGAPSSVTSIQVANLLKLFKIPQVRACVQPRCGVSDRCVHVCSNVVSLTGACVCAPMWRLSHIRQSRVIQHQYRHEIDADFDTDHVISVTLSI